MFGGDSREGGVQGYVEVKFGGPAETVSGYLQQKLGSIIPAFRGVLSLIVGGYAAAAARARTFFASARALRRLNRSAGVIMAGAAVAVVAR